MNSPEPEGDSLRALISDLRVQLADAHTKIAAMQRENSIHQVTDYQIGQMVELGLGGETCIYMQKLLNKYSELLKACKHAVVYADPEPAS